MLRARHRRRVQTRKMPAAGSRIHRAAGKDREKAKGKTMKNVITASTLENYIALLIAIVKNVSQEESFKALDKAVAPRERKMLRLTDADFEDIKKLRAKKVGWKEIGEIYGSTPNNMKQRTFIYQKRKENGNCKNSDGRILRQADGAEKRADRTARN